MKSPELLKKVLSKKIFTIRTIIKIVKKIGFYMLLLTGIDLS